MKPYELTYIISSHIVSEQVENLKKGVEDFVQKNGGVIVKSEKSIAQSLAYPIKKHSSGFFMTLEFNAEEKDIKALKAELEKTPDILRHFIVVKMPAKIMKARRTRKPAVDETKVKSKTENTEVFKEKAIKDEKPVADEDIDKKLDEILSE